jgi:hypothetical protein
MGFMSGDWLHHNICSVPSIMEFNAPINPLKTKQRLIYLKTQSVPHSKHFLSVIKTN